MLLYVMSCLLFIPGGYLKAILEDYKAVAVETGQDIKARPIKSGFVFSILGAVTYLIKTNPSEQSFRAGLVENTNDLLQLSDAIRRPSCDDHMQMLVKGYNEGTIRRLNLGVCSIMWLDNFDKDVDFFQAHCKQLRVGWLNMKERIVDVGVVNRWIYLEKYMEDFDINPQEWPDEPSKKSATS